ncbi:hypothetical protein ABIE89_000283 [Bradyrhizobium niftali]
MHRDQRGGTTEGQQAFFGEHLETTGSMFSPRVNSRETHRQAFHYRMVAEWGKLRIKLAILEAVQQLPPIPG